MYYYSIHIQNQGGIYRLGTVSDPEQKDQLLDFASPTEGLSLRNTHGSTPIDYMDYRNILLCSGPFYENAQITISEVKSGDPIDIYEIPGQPDCLLSSLETETPFLDLDKLESEFPHGLVFGGYESFREIVHYFHFKSEHPFDRAALFFGVVNLTNLFGDRLVVSHAYYLHKTHRAQLGQLAFPRESVSDAFIYEELENIYEQGKSGRDDILQVFESSKLDPLETRLNNVISASPYLYRVDGTLLYPKH